MALKDWTLVTKGKNVIHWGKNYDRDSLFVAHQDYDAEAWGYNKSSEWNVEIDKGHTGLKTLKTSKTKSEAIKFAKSYMRKH